VGRVGPSNRPRTNRCGRHRRTRTTRFAQDATRLGGGTHLSSRWLPWSDCWPRLPSGFPGWEPSCTSDVMQMRENARANKLRRLEALACQKPKLAATPEFVIEFGTRLRKSSTLRTRSSPMRSSSDCIDPPASVQVPRCPGPPPMRWFAGQAVPSSP